MVESMPAAKPTIILTRPAALSTAFHAALLAGGVDADVIEAPVTRIDPVADVTMPEGMTGAIFTSRNGVAYAPDGTSVAWCVGDATASDAQSKGWDARSAGGDVTDLLRRICADLLGYEADARLVHFCGAQTRGNVAETLSDVGISTQKSVVYRQVDHPLSKQAIARISDPISPVFPIFSPNSARRLVAQFPPGAQADFVAISQATADAVPSQFIKRIVIAEAPTAHSLIQKLRHMI